jgi:hypothetical protein
MLSIQHTADASTTRGSTSSVADACSANSPSRVGMCRDPEGHCRAHCILCPALAWHSMDCLFMRQALGGLRRSTSRRLLLRKLGCSPVVRAWFHSMVSSWNRMTDLSEESLLHVALRHNIVLAESAALGWYQDFTVFVQRVGCAPPGGWVVDGGLQSIPVASAMRSFDEWFYSC